MENVEGQCLQQIMKYKQDRRFATEVECARLFVQLVSAIEYMHSLDISHRDIKLENILIEQKTGKLKLIDFGFSCLSKEKLRIFCGTPSYMSPEIVSKREYYGGPSDIWACGVLLFNLITGTFPFKSVTTEKDLFRKILRGFFTISVGPQDLSQELKDLIKVMLSVDPAERPTATMVLAHPWFKLTGCVKAPIGKTSLQSMTSDTTTTARDTTTSQSEETGEVTRGSLAFGGYAKNQ